MNEAKGHLQVNSAHRLQHNSNILIQMHFKAVQLRRHTSYRQYTIGKEVVHYLHPSGCAAGGGGCSAAAPPREDGGVEEEERQEGGEENACQGEEAEGVGEFQRNTPNQTVS